MSSEPQWILFVTQDKRRPEKHDLGSSLCMRLIEERGISSKVAVQDLVKMRDRGVDIPDFVKGTPTLVHRVEYTMYTGSEALFKLMEVRPSISASVASAPQSTRPTTPPPPQPRSKERELPHPKRQTPRAPTPPPPALGEDDDGEDSIGAGFGDLLDRRPDDDTMNAARVTEGDVQALMDARRALDQKIGL